jgi:hypothetical protein
MSGAVSEAAIAARADDVVKMFIGRLLIDRVGQLCAVGCR